MGGAIEIGKYPELGGLQKEFGPVKEGNAQPAGNYEDHKKMEWLQAETNVSLFLNYRAFSVKKEEDRIISITACHIESGEEIDFMVVYLLTVLVMALSVIWPGQTIVWAVKAVLNTVRL